MIYQTFLMIHSEKWYLDFLRYLMRWKALQLFLHFCETMIQSKRWELTWLKKCPNSRSTYDSLLERNYMYELENMWGIVSWTKDHKIEIPYRMFGILPRRYLPDFLVTFADWSREIHETKWAWFLAWASTHAKRNAGTEYCKKHNMVYRFIENSKWAMFSMNNWLENITKYSQKKVGGLDDL